jgi:CheY-like chemotaxis protein
MIRLRDGTSSGTGVLRGELGHRLAALPALAAADGRPATHPREGEVLATHAQELAAAGVDRIAVVPLLGRDHVGVMLLAEAGAAAPDADARRLFASTLAAACERDELQAELEQARRLADAGQFACRVAHDFNNLLTVVIGFTEDVLGRLDGDDARRADLREALAASHRAAAIARELLALAKSARPQRRPAETPAADARPRETVLLVDDDAGVRNLVARHLRRLGYVVREAGSGEEAALLYGDGVDLLLTDHTMPNMSGMELAQQLRERDADLPIVFMSGYGSDQPEGRAIARSAYLRKPMTMDELAHQVRQMLDQDGRRGSRKAAPGDVGQAG